MDTLTINKSNKFSSLFAEINQNDQDSNDFEKKATKRCVTVDKADSYCQQCFNKSIQAFQISFSESIRICLNANCSGTTIGFDLNNNENTKFRYTESIKELNSNQLKVFFDKELENVKQYEEISLFFKKINDPSEDANLIDIGLEQIPSQNSITEMDSEDIKKSNNILTDDTNELLFTDMTNFGMESKINITDEFDSQMKQALNTNETSLSFSNSLNTNQTTIDKQQTQIQNKQSDVLPNITDNTFDDTFLDLLNEDWTTTDFTAFCNESPGLPILENIDNHLQSNVCIQTEQLILKPEIQDLIQTETIKGENSELAQLKTVSESDLFSSLLDENLMTSNSSNGNHSSTELRPVQSIVTMAPSEATESVQDSLESQANTDVKFKSKSRIKITKTNKLKKRQSKLALFDEFELVDDDSSTVLSDLSVKKNETERLKYDSIGENEDSSDHLLPWEVKTTKKRKVDKFQSRISNLELMSLSRTITPAKKPNNKSNSDSSPLIQINSSISKADSASKSDERNSAQGLVNKGTSLKKALSQAENFNTSSKISHLFNKSNLLKKPINNGSGGYKDLVLNVLKKKSKT